MGCCASEPEKTAKTPEKPKVTIEVVYCGGCGWTDLAQTLS